jgi:hypothetical protein
VSECSEGRAEHRNEQTSLALGESPELFVFGQLNAAQSLDRSDVAPPSLAAKKLTDRHTLGLGRRIEENVA